MINPFCISWGLCAITLATPLLSVICLPLPQKSTGIQISTRAERPYIVPCLHGHFTSVDSRRGYVGAYPRPDAIYFRAGLGSA